MRAVILLSILACAVTSSATAQHKHPGDNIKVPSGGLKQPPPPPPPGETLTVLTFFENPDFSGVSYVVQLQPPANGVEGTRVIPQTELADANLSGKVSSVRITCGTRPSRASLFDIDWAQFSSGAVVECTPGQTTDIKLAGDGISRNLDDKINAAALVVHVRSTDNKAHRLQFSTLFTSVWNTQVQNLGKGATAKGTQIWLDDFQDIHVEQMLQVDSTWCSARDAVFDIRIHLQASGNNPAFKVYGISQWVASGFGDAWGCHDGMMSSLSTGVSNASAQLEAQLPNLVLGGPPSPTYYFAPADSTKNYDMFFWK